MTQWHNRLQPGDRALVFDPSLFVDDVKTPLSFTMRPATVLRRYGKRNEFGTYPDLVDVRFDHRPDRESRGHFTDYLVRPSASNTEPDK